MRVRVKICGITNVEDAATAVVAGADALGFVFYQRSPRAVTADEAARIVESLPPFVSRVGLFVDPEPEQVEAVLTQVRLDLLQFHGSEPESACAAFGVPFIKAFNLTGQFDAYAAADRYPSAAALLLDSFVPGLKGGTGRTFDWSYWPRASSKPLILAGGLTPQNVAVAIRATAPFAVDVSGGVEGSTTGRKDPAKLSAFLNEVSRADSVDQVRE